MRVGIIIVARVRTSLGHCEAQVVLNSVERELSAVVQGSAASQVVLVAS